MANEVISGFCLSVCRRSRNCQTSNVFFRVERKAKVHSANWRGWSDSEWGSMGFRKHPTNCWSKQPILGKWRWSLLNHYPFQKNGRVLSNMRKYIGPKLGISLCVEDACDHLLVKTGYLVYWQYEKEIGRLRYLAEKRAGMQSSFFVRVFLGRKVEYVSIWAHSNWPIERYGFFWMNYTINFYLGQVEL